MLYTFHVETKEFSRRWVHPLCQFVTIESIVSDPPSFARSTELKISQPVFTKFEIKFNFWIPSSFIWSEIVSFELMMSELLICANWFMLPFLYTELGVKIVPAVFENETRVWNSSNIGFNSPVLYKNYRPLYPIISPHTEKCQTAAPAKLIYVS